LSFDDIIPKIASDLSIESRMRIFLDRKERDFQKLFFNFMPNPDTLHTMKLFKV